MRLKEIKPGMAIHCKNKEEKKALLEEAERIGYLWANGTKPTKAFFPSNTLVFQVNGLKKYISWTGDSEKNTEFSSLILPELTAEETIKLIGELCKGSCQKCPLHGVEPYEICENLCYENPGKAVEILAQWKADHEKKEPEIETEWFWQGRIFKINEDDWHCQINDGTVFYDTGCEYRESAEEYMEGELKEYCKTHEGKFIAVVDHVCRIKR